jgi:hypothetical protein
MHPYHKYEPTVKQFLRSETSSLQSHLDENLDEKVFSKFKHFMAAWQTDEKGTMDQQHHRMRVAVIAVTEPTTDPNGRVQERRGTGCRDKRGQL